MADESNTDVLELTAKIVSAHIGTNEVTVTALPGLIQSVYRSLAMAGTAEPAPAPPTPAVPIRRSVFPNYIVCLEDGKTLKMLKRYLRVRHGMTPEQYRQRWGLPADYPSGTELPQSPFEPGEADRPWPKASQLGTDELGGNGQGAGPAA